MTLEELKTLFGEMLSKGMRPMLCDTEVPLYDSSVLRGDPTKCADALLESMLMPKEMISMHPEIMITVWGEWMKNAGVELGDIARVMMDALPLDGDIVLANIDGEFSLKTYFEDEEGRKWLVPQNEDYSPILLDGSQKVRIWGVLKQIVKTAPRVPIRLCTKAVKDALKAKEEAPKISPEDVSYAIKEIAPKITFARLWYAVYRMMADYSLVQVEDYDTFIYKVQKEVPHHKFLPTKAELQRLAVQSFAKPVKQWTPEDAPVKGQRFKNYLAIALRTEELLLSKQIS